MLRKINKIVNDENFQFLSFIGIFSTLGIYLSYKLILFLRSSKLKKIEINLSKLNMGIVCLLKKNENRKKRNSLFYFPSGLVNYANNCYINVFLQCISTLKSFANFSLIEIIKKGNLINIDILSAFNETLIKINSSIDKILYPSDLITSICRKFEFANEQQDSYELYHRIIDLYSPKSDNENPLKLSIESKFKCQRCQHVRFFNKKEINKVEFYKDISISPKNFNSSVQNEINNYSSYTIIDDYVCANCTLNSIINQLNSNTSNKTKELISLIKESISLNLTLEDSVTRIVSFLESNKMDSILKQIKFAPIRTNLIKSTKILSTNQALIVHINSVDSNYNKIDRKIKFSNFLNINDKKYELKAYVCHSGAAAFGHYYCYRKFYENRWLFISDANVKWIEDSSNNFNLPYMLFYELI